MRAETTPQTLYRSAYLTRQPYPLTTENALVYRRGMISQRSMGQTSTDRRHGGADGPWARVEGLALPVVVLITRAPCGMRA